MASEGKHAMQSPSGYVMAFLRHFARELLSASTLIIISTLGSCADAQRTEQLDATMEQMTHNASTPCAGQTLPARRLSDAELPIVLCAHQKRTENVIQVEGPDGPNVAQCARRGAELAREYKRRFKSPWTRACR